MMSNNFMYHQFNLIQQLELVTVVTDLQISLKVKKPRREKVKQTTTTITDVLLSIFV